MTDLQVMIVGAGPTGLTAALCLKQLGIECMVIDKKEGPVTTSNALGVQARTLEIWESLGIVNNALLQGHPIHGLNIYSDNKEIGHISLKELDTIYSYILALPQAQTENILLKKLHELGCDVHRNTTFISAKQDPDKVEVVYQQNNEAKKTLNVKWLLGCDGSHSKVRDILKIEFIGKSLPQHFVMADLPIKSNWTKDRARGFFSSEGVMFTFPLKGYNRLIFEVSKDPTYALIKGAPDFDVFKDLTKKRCHFPIELEQPLWTSSFWIHEHVANCYAKDRIFLLGDAAHEHSPVGGQGMNTGIQDAYNLCWKLALVEKEYLKKSFLMSYEAERLPVAKALVEATTRATYIITTSSSFLKTVRNFVLKCISHFLAPQELLSKTLSELKVNYRNSQFVGESAGWYKGITPGTRVPYQWKQKNGQYRLLQKLLSKEKYTLFIFADKNHQSKQNNEKVKAFANTIDQKFADLITCIMVTTLLDSGKMLQDNDGTLYDLFAVSKDSFYLVRPDQYVAYRGIGLNEENLLLYFNKIGIQR